MKKEKQRHTYLFPNLPYIQDRNTTPPWLSHVLLLMD